MSPDPFTSYALAMLAAMSIGLVVAVAKLNGDFNRFQVDAAKEYANIGDIVKLEKSIEGIQSEMKSVLEIMYEIRADIRAGNLRDRRDG